MSEQMKLEPGRYVLEGTWSGYVSRQARVVHREAISYSRAKALQNLHCIVYTDGTTLNLSMRKAKPRERVRAILGYCSLIRDAQYSGESVYTVRPKKLVEACSP